jgi:hypothetical protein
MTALYHEEIETKVEISAEVDPYSHRGTNVVRRTFSEDMDTAKRVRDEICPRPPPRSTPDQGTRNAGGSLGEIRWPPRCRRSKSARSSKSRACLGAVRDPVRHPPAARGRARRPTPPPLEGRGRCGRK